jgi:hypothetical protein
VGIARPDAGLFQLPQLLVGHGVLVLDHLAPLLAATVAQPEDGGLPNCYFCDPGELPALFSDAGLAVQHICATEGPFGGRVGRFHALERPVREAWLQFILHNCEEPILVWASEHILVVARKE